MPSIPAFCDTCGAVFHSGIVVENSTNVTFSGNRAGPCPACGGIGHIPDGVFNFIGNTIEILSAPERTVEELTRLSDILREAKEKQQSPEEVAERIQKELPSLAGIGALLPKNRAELYGFLAVILAAAQLLQSSLSSQQPPVTINITQVVNQAAAQPSAIPSGPRELAPVI
jgi:hypothetical protein